MLPPTFCCQAHFGPVCGAVKMCGVHLKPGMCGIETLIFRAIETYNPNRLGALLALRFSQVGEKPARNFIVL
jgi:hypothetical protein